MESDLVPDRKKLQIRYATLVLKDKATPSFFIAATDKGVCFTYFPASDRFIGYLQKKYNAELIEDKEYFKVLHKELDDYLAGKIKQFSCSVDFLDGTEFQRKVWKAMMTIPYGETRTYQWIAEKTGSPKGFRAAGGACHNNPVPLIVPCHRVIGKDGSMTGYGGPTEEGRKRKAELLRLEGAIE
jgi:methylated-DNA-[protein]-cysteine S-methyltransferase